MHSRFGFVHIFRVGSVLATLSVSVERFVAIIYPLRTIKMTAFLIISSTVCTILYNIPRFFEFKTYPIYQNATMKLANESPSDDNMFVNVTIHKVGKACMVPHSMPETAILMV